MSVLKSPSVFYTLLIYTESGPVYHKVLVKK